MFLKWKPIRFVVQSCCLLALASFAIAQGEEAEKPKVSGASAAPPHHAFREPGKGHPPMRHGGGFREGRGSRHRRGGHGFGRGDRSGWMRWLHSPRILRALDLSEQQSQKLKDIGLEAEKVAIRKRADLQIQRLELARLVGVEIPDRGAIEDKLEQIGQIRTALSRSMMSAFLDGRGVLTEDQRAKFKGLIRKRGGRRGSGPRPSSPPSPE